MECSNNASGVLIKLGSTDGNCVFFICSNRNKLIKYSANYSMAISWSPPDYANINPVTTDQSLPTLGPRSRDPSDEAIRSSPKLVSLRFCPRFPPFANFQIFPPAVPLLHICRVKRFNCAQIPGQTAQLAMCLWPPAKISASCS